MKIRISAGAAALHACSTLTGQSVLTREGALLAFAVDDLDLDDTLGALKAADDEIGEAILATDNEAEIAGFTDLRRLVQDIEREVRGHFQVRDATMTEPTVTDTGSQPTATGDAAISIAPQQSSDAVQNEEIVDEPSQQPEPQQQPRRRRG
ncbi:hypothetical protein [Sphingomonas melonis]|uniref:hypothetical protein n=1 Tax=Sphingomonas melonis TaxID=152682 RepID=UPI0035C7A760